MMKLKNLICILLKVNLLKLKNKFGRDNKNFKY